MADEPNSNTLKGVLWMIFTGLLFVGVTALVKKLGTRIPAAESAFLRYVFGVLLLAPLFMQLSRVHFGKPIVGLFALRGFAHTFGVSLWFYAMARIPIADVTALNYLTPVYVTLGAALFLGERLALRRIVAVLAALIGAAIILRPGFRALEMGHLAMLVAAMFFSISYLSAKKLADEIEPALVVLVLSIAVSIGLFPMALAVWVTPTTWELAILFGVALLATLGHYTMTLALRAAPVMVTQPATFLQLVWAVLLGIVVFGEVFDIWVVVGGAVILASVSYMSWRETVIKRREVTPPSIATKF
jgi:drug/metabolite transporter (DMT)-like permease